MNYNTLQSMRKGIRRLILRFSGLKIKKHEFVILILVRSYRQATYFESMGTVSVGQVRFLYIVEKIDKITMSTRSAR